MSQADYDFRSEDIEMLFYKSNQSRIKNEKVFYEMCKRVFDVVFSFLALIVAVPFIIIFGLLIRLESEGNIIYKQERVGLHGKVFTIYKLRSMYTNAERSGAVWAQKDDPRITKVGKFIRKTRIDELPQIYNVLKGEMSIIGPRPERPGLTCEFEKEIPGFVERVSIKPGLTGWAQINGGYDLTPSEKFELDMEYIRRRGFYMDLIILLKTIKVVFTGEGAR